MKVSPERFGINSSYFLAFRLSRGRGESYCYLIKSRFPFNAYNLWQQLMIFYQTGPADGPTTIILSSSCGSWVMLHIVSKRKFFVFFFYFWLYLSVLCQQIYTRPILLIYIDTFKQVTYFKRFYVTLKKVYWAQNTTTRQYNEVFPIGNSFWSRPWP